MNRIKVSMWVNIQSKYAYSIEFMYKQKSTKMDRFRKCHLIK